ncbi:MAG: ASCH domain-containing protein [Thermoprotei archaeon]|nr:MAG: ASCH domain-containing protein [Thermoprotei archaeon]
MVRYLGRHLMLSGKYVRDVLEGRKRATVRVGRYAVKSRDVFLHSGGRVVAKLRIERVYHKRFSELDDEDARLDGHPNARSLRKELRRIYGHLRPDTPVTVIVFRVERRLEVNEGSRWMGLDPVDVARIGLRYWEELGLGGDDRRIVEEVVRRGSLRAVSKALYGTIEKRRRIRRALRRVLERLLEKGLLERPQRG